MELPTYYLDTDRQEIVMEKDREPIGVELKETTVLKLLIVNGRPLRPEEIDELTLGTGYDVKKEEVAQITKKLRERLNEVDVNRHICITVDTRPGQRGRHYLYSSQAFELAEYGPFRRT